MIVESDKAQERRGAVRIHELTLTRLASVQRYGSALIELFKHEVFEKLHKERFLASS